MIAGVLLAAGAGIRFGGDKLLAPLPDGTPVGVRAARTLLDGVDRALAVVRPGDAALARLLVAEGLEVAACPGAAKGMGTSLAFGVAACSEAEGWVVALADMPFVRRETVEAVARSLRSGAWIAAPSHGGRRGHPVGFSGALYPDLAALEGEVGAREIVARYASRVRVLETDDPGILLDIDTLRDVSSGDPVE